jgi:mRNA interferase HigB
MGFTYRKSANLGPFSRWHNRAKHAAAKGPLEAWFHEAEASNWRGPQDIKKHCQSADILPGNRIVFDIKGNTFRLIVKIHYNRSIVFIRFVGTHAQYDKIDARTI